MEEFDRIPINGFDKWRGSELKLVVIRTLILEFRDKLAKHRKDREFTANDKTCSKRKLYIFKLAIVGRIGPADDVCLLYAHLSLLLRCFLFFEILALCCDVRIIIFQYGRK